MPPKNVQSKSSAKVHGTRSKGRSISASAGPSERQRPRSIDLVDSENGASPVLPVSDRVPKSQKTSKKTSRFEKELDKQLETEAEEVRLLKKRVGLHDLQLQKALLTSRLEAGNSSSPEAENSTGPGLNVGANQVAVSLEEAAQEDLQVTIDQVAAGSPHLTVPRPADSLSGASKPQPPPAVAALQEQVAQQVSLATLRADSILQARVSKHMSDLGLEESPELKLDASSIKGNKLVSGRNAKSENNISRAVTWPHSVIETKFTSDKITYDHIEFPLLVAGEIGIILDSKTSKEESTCRLTLLKLLSYGYKHCRWSVLRQHHGATLEEIEKGTREWTDLNFSDLTTCILVAAAQSTQPTTQRRSDSSNNPKRTRRPRSKPGEKHYFCQDYNRAVCIHGGEHEGIVNEESVLVEHICAKCILRDGAVAHHSELNCPRYKPRD